MKKKYPQLKEFYYTDKNAYQREWRKLNPRIKDEWRKLDKNIYDELPSDVVAIPGYPTYYAQPSGEIWRDTRQSETAIKCGKARVLKLTSTYNAHNGYLIVQPYIGLKRHAVHVHRLILTTFSGPVPEEGMECHHIIEIRTDNRIENLMWVTRLENIRFVSMEKKMQPKKKLNEGRKVSESKWYPYHSEIKKLYNSGMRGFKIAEKLGIPRSVVYYTIKNINLNLI